MRLRKPHRPLTPEEVTERNIRRNTERTLNPPKPSLWERVVMRRIYAAEEFWCRHVTQRELHRVLDGARLAMPSDEIDRGYPDYYPWRDDDGQA